MKEDHDFELSKKNEKIKSLQEQIQKLKFDKNVTDSNHIKGLVDNINKDTIQKMVNDQISKDGVYNQMYQQLQDFEQQTIVIQKTIFDYKTKNESITNHNKQLQMLNLDLQKQIVETDNVILDQQK